MSLWERQKNPAPVGTPAKDAAVRFGRTIESLVTRLKRMTRPSLLDLGPTCGSTIEYFIRLGCRVQADDYIPGLLSRPVPPSAAPATGRPSAAPRPSPMPPVEHESGRFDAVLCWDLFDYLPAPEAEQVGREVRRVTAEGGYVLAFFGPRTETATVAPRRFRIGAAGDLAVEDVAGPRRAAHHLANRDVQRIFPDFEIAQTVLLKNGVREMLLQKRRSSPAPA
jgi:methyltransferase family protein